MAIEVTFVLRFDDAYAQYVDVGYIADAIERTMFYDEDIPCTVEATDVDDDA